ncbi:hypothetical protein ACFLSQ_03450 [Bacteroidota bacterium]
MLIKYIIRLILFFLLVSVVLSQTQLRNNFDILDSLVKKHAENISRQILEKGINKAQIQFSEHPALRLIKQNLFEVLKKNKFELIDTNVENSSSIDIFIKNAEIIYLNIENKEDSLERQVKVQIAGNITYNGGKVDIINEQTNIFHNVISREDIPFIKSKYDYANAPVPEPHKTFLEEIAEPLIVVASAILVIILLFTVRSG